MRVVFCTSPKEHSDRIAESILESKLAACVNIVDGIKSKYWWEGKIQTDQEAMLIIKTRAELIDPLCHKIKELHPYDLPEIIALKIEGGSSDYLNWIKELTS